MRDQGIWSISLGTWGGVRVRLHASFLLFAAFTVYLAWLDRQLPGVAFMPSSVSSGSAAPGFGSTSTGADPASVAGFSAWLAAAGLVTLYVAVLAHELGHVLTAFRLGGGADEIVLAPWGGVNALHVPDDPQAEAAAVVAGPLVNLLLAWALCFPILLVHGVSVSELLHPLAPTGLLGGGPDEPLAAPWLLFVKLAFWINWTLFLVNLLPVYPFDGGAMVRAGLLWVWPDLNRRWSAVVVTRFARLAALLLLVAAWISRDEPATGPAPAWLALVVLAGLVFFSARQREARILAEATAEAEAMLDDADATRDGEGDEEYGFERDLYDPYGLDGTADRDGESERASERTSERAEMEREAAEPSGPVERWMQRRKTQQQRRQREIEADDDRRVDEVLARLHEVGLANLSAADRALLQRVSERYRDRLNRRT